MKPFSRANKGTRLYLRIFAIFLAICIVITAVWLQYYQSLYSTIRDENRSYLQEVARRIGSNIDRIIGDNFAVLSTMASSLEATGNLTFETTRSLLQAQQKHWNYENLLLIGEAGQAYDLEGREVFFDFEKSMRESILQGKQAMSTTQIINNQEFIFFCVPLHNVQLGGKTVTALAASYSPDSFDQVLSMTSFDEQAYSQIVTKSGTVVTRPTSPYALKTGYNIFSTLQSAELTDGSDLTVLRDDLTNNRADYISFTVDGTERYLVYTPIQPDEWYLLTFLPVQVVNEKSDLLLRTTLIICGLITVAFASLCVTLIVIFNNNKRRLEQIAYVDPVTDGNTIQHFYELAGDALESFPGKNYALVYTNIEKFKVLNEQLGAPACDLLLRAFYDFIQSTLTAPECIGRITADNFCILMEFLDEKTLIDRFRYWRLNSEEYLLTHNLLWGLPVTEFGVYVLENRTLPFPQMVDRAKLALRETPCSIVDSKMHYAFYDDGLRRQLFREKLLEDKMEGALVNREFKVFLQPKYHLPEERVGGAEALVRWISPDEGMIFPNDFIPLFEKNGFIVQVDLYVFEEVCRTIRAWVERGLTPVKVSVNCSRVHFKTINFLDSYIRIADQYGVDKGLLEIELTESIVFENSDHLTDIIHYIRSVGFGCSMDDFGSGYSSLNLIQSIPVDTLKLDKIFFQSSSVEFQRTEAVVTNIVSLARSLSMETVAEGVEHREQVEMLKRAGCDYIQGYVFAKPMSIDAFENLVFGTSIQE